MRIDRESLVATQVDTHDSGCLPPDPRQRFQLCSRDWHLAAMSFDERSRRGDDVFSLAPEKPAAANKRLELGDAGPGI